MPIKFGTDGWRAIMGDEYTIDNVMLCAQATANLMKSQGVAKNGIIIGFDTRFGSEKFAAATAEVMAANNISTMLCDRPVPTPVVSYNVKKRGAGAGVVITASHNPAEWNGFKFKPHYGGSATPDLVSLLESQISSLEVDRKVENIPLEEACREGIVSLFDAGPIYRKNIKELVDLDSIRNAGLNVAVDSMFGSGAGYFAALLEGGDTKVIELRGEPNPLFPGMTQPEPIAHNLSQLISTIRGQSFDVGLATDGDADRLGVVCDRGKFITTLQTFALICFHQLEFMKRRGPLVRSITMTSAVDKLGKIYDVQTFVTPVGFKFLGPVMMREDALVAGEESGGYAFRGNIPERDGILSGLMILEMMVNTNKRISELVEMLTDLVGAHHYHRLDLTFKDSERKTIYDRLSVAKPKKLANRRVDSIETCDGFRFVLDGGYWSLVRFSGTEPLLRVYAEAESKFELENLIADTRAITGL